MTITAGTAGTQFTCANVQYLAGSGAFACVLPTSMPAEYGGVYFIITVRGQMSAVSTFSFLFSSSYVAPAFGAAATITFHLSGE